MRKSPGSSAGGFSHWVMPSGAQVKIAVFMPDVEQGAYIIVRKLTEYPTIMLAHVAPRTILRHAMVQAEWTNTLDRILHVCPVLETAEVVQELKFAYIILHRDHEDKLPEVETILFQNLLLCPLQRIVDRQRIIISADWLWNWRKSVPWTSDEAGSLNRLYPGAPEKTFTYRFHWVEVEE